MEGHAYILCEMIFIKTDARKFSISKMCKQYIRFLSLHYSPIHITIFQEKNEKSLENLEKSRLTPAQRFFFAKMSFCNSGMIQNPIPITIFWEKFSKIPSKITGKVIFVQDKIKINLDKEFFS